MPARRAGGIQGLPASGRHASPRYLVWFFYEVIRTRLPTGTRDMACSAAAGTRTQPWLTARPNTDGSGQPCTPTVPGPPPKVSSVLEWNPSGRTSGLGWGGASNPSRKVRPVGVGVAGAPTVAVQVPSSRAPVPPGRESRRSCECRTRQGRRASHARQHCARAPPVSRVTANGSPCPRCVEARSRPRTASGRSKGPTAVLAIRPLTCISSSGGGI